MSRLKLVSVLECKSRVNDDDLAVVIAGIHAVLPNLSLPQRPLTK